MSSIYADEILKVKNLLKEFERFSKKSLGQNFLINRKKIELIISLLLQSPAKEWVEIGPGLGALTSRLLEKNKQTLLVELDSDFAQYWRGHGAHVFEGDALCLDWLKELKGSATLVSNLPYQIAARLVVDLSFTEHNIDVMILMFQKEVAQRMAAQLDSSDYSLLSVVSQTFWKVEKVTDLGPNDYYPPPKVGSRVLRFQRRLDAQEMRSKGYLQFLKLAFSQRRKLVKKVLSSQFPTENILTALTQLNINPQARAEDISVELYAQLFKLLNHGN